MVSSRETRDSYALQKVSNRSNTTKESKVKHESDADSDYAILEENLPRAQRSVDEIVKTTEVSVTVDDKTSERSRGGDWV
jgi:fructose-1,6-bisphosphatase